MGLVPILHADDCGLSPGITDSIVKCHDHGWLARTSVIVNGVGWEHAVTALRSRPRLGVGLHLNFFEGRPLSPRSEVDLLVDQRGYFHRGFAGLWVRGLAGRASSRLRRQVRAEMRRQIGRFQDAFGDRGALLLDGHRHYQVLPLVFHELVALCSEYPIGAIRLPRETLYWPLTRGAPRPPAINVVKNVVLRALSRRAAPALAARGVMAASAFVGVLGTSAMTVAHVRAALEHLRRARISGTVEILFHPGRARSDEAWMWNERPDLRAIYLSAARDREAAVLCSEELAQLLRGYDALGDAGLSPAPPVSVSA